MQPLGAPLDLCWVEKGSDNSAARASHQPAVAAARARRREAAARARRREAEGSKSDLIAIAGATAKTGGMTISAG